MKKKSHREVTSSDKRCTVRTVLHIGLETPVVGEVSFKVEAHKIAGAHNHKHKKIDWFIF